MSKRSIPNVDWANQLESVIRQFVKEKLELIMREEIKHFLEIEQAGTPNRRNGCYLRCVRKKDQFEMAEDLKLIYRSPNKEIALEMFQQFQSKWSHKYPREVQSWANELDVLLTFMDYPSSIRSVIYTTNAIERTIKEIRKRLKPMNSLSSLEVAEKVVYLTIQDFNEKWAGRKLRGFAE